MKNEKTRCNQRKNGMWKKVWKVWITLCKALSKNKLCKGARKVKNKKTKWEKVHILGEVGENGPIRPMVILTKGWREQGKKEKDIDFPSGKAKMITLCINR